MRGCPSIRAKAVARTDYCCRYFWHRFFVREFEDQDSGNLTAGWPGLSILVLPNLAHGCPVLALFARAGRGALCTILFAMPSGLHRSYGAHHLHFITSSCYRRLPFLRTARHRHRLLAILEQTRERYRFVVVGYVVMPEHIHLLITEPEVGTPSTVMQVLKQRSARALLPKEKRADPRQRHLFGDEAVRTPFLAGPFL